MRCFIAVDLDSTLKEKILDLQAGLKGLDTKLIEPENLHFTLKFLGEVDVNTLNEVKDRLNALLKERGSFNIDLEKLGAFPNEHFIRVVWIGVEKLMPLQKDVNDSLNGVFPVEKPIPHLTLARVRSQIHREEIIKFIENNRNVKAGSMKVNQIKIKKSTITTKGPVYEDLEVFSLKPSI